MNRRDFMRELDKERKNWAPLEKRLKEETYAAKLRIKKNEKVTTIKLHEITKEKLGARRAYPDETYESVITRLLA